LHSAAPVPGSNWHSRHADAAVSTVNAVRSAVATCARRELKKWGQIKSECLSSRIGTLKTHVAASRAWRYLEISDVSRSPRDRRLAVDPATSFALAFDQRGIGYPRTLGGKVDAGAFQHQPAAGDRIFADAFESGP